MESIDRNMPPIPVKSTEKLAYAKAKGENKGKFESWTKMPFDQKALEYIKVLTANLDIMECAAIIGSTIVVHDVIMKTKDFTDAVLKLAQDAAKDTTDIYKGASELITATTNTGQTEAGLHLLGGGLGILGKLPLFSALFPEYNIASDALQKAADQMEPLPTTKYKRSDPLDLTVVNAQKSEQLLGNIMLWLVSFAIAYYAIKHGLELLNVAKMFFGKGLPI